MTIQYYSGKYNIVVDILSHKAVSMDSLALVRVSKQPLDKEFKTLASYLCSLVFQKGVKYWLVLR